MYIGLFQGLQDYMPVDLFRTLLFWVLKAEGYFSVRELEVELTQMAKRLRMKQPKVVYALSRGERIVKDKAIQMIE